jgi:hypothetical protein
MDTHTPLSDQDDIYNQIFSLKKKSSFRGKLSSIILFFFFLLMNVKGYYLNSRGFHVQWCLVMEYEVY